MCRQSSAGFGVKVRIQEEENDHKCEVAIMKSASAPPEQLTHKRILSVRCPVCRAKPKERCTFTTGHPSEKTHLDRGRAAANAPRPESTGLAALRSLRNLTSFGLDVLFRHK
jgi:hypothetical protein